LTLPGKIGAPVLDEGFPVLLFGIIPRVVRRLFPVTRLGGVPAIILPVTSSFPVTRLGGVPAVILPVTGSFPVTRLG